MSDVAFNGAKVLRPGSFSRPLVYGLMWALVIVAAMLGLCAGRYPVSPGNVIDILLSQVWPRPAAWLPIEERIVTLVRAPRVVLVGISGAGLAIAGAAMQGIFRNPLASPQTLGVSAGAAFGGALGILFGISGYLLVAGAFTTGVLSLLVVGLIARLGGRSDTATVVLAGIIVGTFFAALVSLTQLFADPQTSLPSIVFWLMGSFATATWDRVYVAAPIVAAGAALLWMMRFRINVLSLREEEAQSLGVNVERDRWLAFLFVALIVGATVSVAGIVAWVGLVVPHAARLLVGHDHRHLLPVSCLLGAAYLTFIDMLARTSTTMEIPLGVLTALIGAPFVAVLLRRTQRGSQAT